GLLVAGLDRMDQEERQRDCPGARARQREIQADRGRAGKFCEGARLTAHAFREDVMWAAVVAALLLSLCSPAFADDIPQFQIDAFWPKPLPNNWILGQVSGIATDKYDRIWVVHRPLSLTPRERAAEQNPPEAKCCKAAPPVLLFDNSG